jgi:hypothetical protein
MIMKKIQVAPGLEITIDDRDLSILKGLAGRIAEIAALPVQEHNRELWRGVNDLKRKTAVIIKHDEVPWTEMNINGELDLKTTDRFAQSVESQMRGIIYQWEHMPCNMVVEPVLLSWLAIIDLGFGFDVKEEVIPQGVVEGSGDEGWVSAHHYNPQIKDEKDIEKIGEPNVTFNAEISAALHEARMEFVGDILEVRKCGIANPVFALWDDLVTLWGSQELLLDMIERPELVHLAIKRYAEVNLKRLQIYEDLGVLTWDPNYYTGAGGPGYTDDLPGKDFDPGHVKLKNIWGHCTAQIFGSVSPRMHEEFALNYELPLMERMGLQYYGCCEPLHDRIKMLRKIPNLRKISMSPWANLEKGVEQIGNDYVLSVKPNPAMLAARIWEPEKVRSYFIDVFEKTRGCSVEIIVKDISTVNGQPQRLWEMADIAMEVAGRYR